MEVQAIDRRHYKVDKEKVVRVKEQLSKGLSQRQIARAVGISQFTVWNIKHGNYDTTKPLPTRETGYFNW